jgi:hypothetical protein
MCTHSSKQPTTRSPTRSRGATPPSPCKVKTVTGTLDVSWADGKSSTASVGGKLRDSKAMSLSGTFSSTDLNYPGLPAAILLNNFPPSPCWPKAVRSLARARPGPSRPLSELSVTATIDSTGMTTATIRGAFT